MSEISALSSNTETTVSPKVSNLNTINNNNNNHVNGGEITILKKTTSTTSNHQDDDSSRNTELSPNVTPTDIETLTKDEIDRLRSSLNPILSNDEELGLHLANMFVVEVVPQSANKLIGELSKILNQFENDKTITYQYGHLKKMRKVVLDNNTSESSLIDQNSNNNGSNKDNTIDFKTTENISNNNDNDNNKNKEKKKINKKDENCILELFIGAEENYPNFMQYYEQSKLQQHSEQPTQDTKKYQEIKNITDSHSRTCFKELTDYQKRLIQFINNHKLQLKIVKIPRYPPLTYEIWQEWNKIWPITYKVHCFSTPLVETLDDQEIVIMNTFMKKAIEQAKIAKKLSYNPVGAVLVDPTTNIIHAEAFDQTPSPFKHSNNSNSNNNECCKSIKYLLSPILSHCTMNIIHKLASQHIDRHIQKNGVLTLSSMQTTANSDEDAYLATDLYLYITREPCVMCSMALVHSRIKRVIFGAVQPNAGGLGGYLKVHTQKSINHRFQVYQGIHEDQCIQLFNDDDT